MAGNPWGVPRAIPGSHDLELMATALDQWRETGVLNAPRFDKSLRQGRGDRSESDPKRHIHAGWKWLGLLPTPSDGFPLTVILRQSEFQVTAAEQSL